jgi:hypothetical protein
MRARKRAAGMREVRRWVPTPTPSSYSDHRLHEIRSLALHGLIARKLCRDPDLLRVAERNLARWRKSDPDPPAYLDEWEHILAQPLPYILDRITAMDAEAIRLRQSSPFAGALSAEERDRLFEAFRA